MIYQIKYCTCFPYPEPPNINILYGWSEIPGQFGLCYFMFYFVTSSKLITFGLLYYIVTFSFFLFCALFLYFFLCPYNSIKSVDCILLSSLLLNAILLTSSVNRLCFLLLFLCCDFKINRLFFRNFLWFSSRRSTATPFYSNCLFYFQAKLLLNNFYNG